MTEQTFRGKTEDAESPFLGAKFWRTGVNVVGVVERSFETENGTCFVCRTMKPLTIEGVEVERFSIGNMAGFKMALQAGGLSALRIGDRLNVTCTGETPATKADNSPRVNFDVEVKRS